MSQSGLAIKCQAGTADGPRFESASAYLSFNKLSFILVVVSTSDFATHNSPRGLTFTWWGASVYVFDVNQPSLPTPFYSVLASISIFMAFSTLFHSINSPDNSPLSHSVLPVLSLPYWSF